MISKGLKVEFIGYLQYLHSEEAEKIVNFLSTHKESNELIICNNHMSLTNFSEIFWYKATAFNL